MTHLGHCLFGDSVLTKLSDALYRFGINWLIYDLVTSLLSKETLFWSRLWQCHFLLNWRLIILKVNNLVDMESVLQPPIIELLLEPLVLDFLISELLADIWKLNTSLFLFKLSIFFLLDRHDHQVRVR
jgi:hypothetical protein